MSFPEDFEYTVEKQVYEATYFDFGRFQAVQP